MTDMNDATPYIWTPPSELAAASNLTAFLRATGQSDYDELASRAEADPAWLMQEVFKFCDVRFYRDYDQMLDVSSGQAWARWCVGGTTNIVLNCLDKHRDTAVWDQTFLVWEGEDKRERRSLTYREFDLEVGRLAQGLHEIGIGRGDVVAIYMPNLPETLVAFFAILKLGAIVMPLFSGFGPAPIQARLNHGEAKAVITADGTWRRGTSGPLKSVLDMALEASPTVRHVIVARRGNLAIDTPMRKGRDLWWDDAIAGKGGLIETAEMQAEDPAILLYTSGTSGEPKGCVWNHIGFIGSMVTRDTIICGDFKSTDRFFFFSDMGWMVGSMCACVPSFAGGSLLVVEGTPDYPDTARFWRLIAEHRVTYLGVSPTIVRGLMRYGIEVESYDLSSLRMTASGGEAWATAPWLWFFEHVCKKRVPIINMSGGTEVGGCIFTGTPNHPMNPGSFARPALGVGADIVDLTGQRVPDGTVGELVLRHSSIGLTKSLWKADARYIESYWSTLPGLWVHGDFAMRGRDGLYYILGRSDDTIKIAGKRTGPSELEGILIATGKLAEAAVFGIPHPVKGSAIVCACVPMPGVMGDRSLENQLSLAIVAGMGPSYRPEMVLFVDDLPRTRNMKIMRRVLRAVFEDKDPGDLSALANPEAVDMLREKLAGK
ncbi:AMP-binding protein [Bradyrhizobium sp. Arg237L]|uniref:AMP-binding protein n=1 Tax=Bradyrhizobium sp. Arg237L TaxID=3003352 RepID=UPI00249EFA19|nr:AMP-binding protein [Bradyrhizobium sp. Arg237L]MDI4234208.1 AMP-binding protein [Bradyrhizobium sp. Arg237L]